VDPNTARQVLRIFPDAPLTVDLVERAFAGESATRPAEELADPGSGHREAALQTARTVLLAAIEADAAPAALEGLFPTATTAPPRVRTRLGRGAITGIVLACVLTITWMAGGTVGLVMVLDRVGSGLAASEADPRTDAFQDTAWSDRMTSQETGFTFPTALEVYADGRYDDLCSSIYEDGCWQLDVIPEKACPELRVEVGFSNDRLSPYPEVTRVSFIGAARSFERVPMVYGDNDYSYGWIADVTCERDTA